MSVVDGIEAYFKRVLPFSANPIGAAAGGGGETRVAVRRRPSHGERIQDEPPRVGQGVRLVARRPNALPEVPGDRGNYVTVRRRPTSEVSL